MILNIFGNHFNKRQTTNNKRQTLKRNPYFCKMYSSPENLPSSSRIWIYQANRFFTNDEESEILKAGKQFVESWTAHNQALKASIEIRHHAFLIIMVDQEHAGASGCSIDKSVHFIQQIEKQFGIKLLDRMVVAYKDNSDVCLTSLNDFNALISKGKINPNTVVFNNLVSSKGDLTSNWEVPVSKSWHNQLLAL